MSKQRGFAVVSGSGSTAIVAKIMENGRVDFGSSVKPVEMHVTGTLVLDQLSGSTGLTIGGAGRVLLVGTNGTASIGQLTSSHVLLDSGMSANFGGATSVSGALAYLSGNLSAGAITSITAGDGLTSTGGSTPTLSVNVGEGLAISSDNVVVSGAVDLTDNKVIKWNNSESKFVNSSLTDNGSTVSVAANLTVTGNLTVNGTTTSIDTQTLTVEDAIIALGKNSTGSLTDGDRGLIFARSSGNQGFGWDESADTFKLGTTFEDASGANLYITASATLELGTLSGSIITGSTAVITTQLTASLVRLGTVDITSNLTVQGNLTATGSVYLGSGSNVEVLMNGKFRVPVFTVSGTYEVTEYPRVPADFVTNSSIYGGYSFYLTSSQGSVDGIVPGQDTWTQGNKWYFNENGEWFASFFYSV